MKSQTITAALLCIAFVSGCARRETEDEAPAANEAAVAPTVAEAPPPPKEVAAVKVEVSLSAEAEQKLKAAGEGVQVEVVYGGDPAPGASLQPNELGMIELGKKVLELDSSGSVELPESEVDRSRLDQIVGQPQIMVNTTSTRRSTPQNLIACGFYWDTLSKAGSEGVKIACTPLAANGG